MTMPLVRHLGPARFVFDTNAIRVPLPFGIYHYQDTLALGFGVGSPGIDPIFEVTVEIRPADLPPACADLLDRVLP